jgi:hypothetical protein
MEGNLEEIGPLAMGMVDRCETGVLMTPMPFDRWTENFAS